MNETIQKIIDIAFDCENRFADDETVQVTVEGFAELARSYMALRAALQSSVEVTTQRILDAEETIEKVKKLLNQ
jgi:hypothetical protein